MRLSFASFLLAAGGSVSGAAVPVSTLAPALPLSAFETTEFRGITLEQALALPNHAPPAHKAETVMLAAAATCSNPRVRVEWDNMSNNDKQNFVNAIKCLLGKGPSGQFSQAKNRYEDLVALHQTLTPNVHNNAKFLLWHRYYLWTFEDIMRSECGFSGPLPWFDESRYAGKFSQSSIFSSSWLGGIAVGGNCVTNGQFAGLTLHVGPGPGNGDHCLSRNGDASETALTGSSMVSACNAKTDYADMAGCAEISAHAHGHNGIGGPMRDVYASPGDPVFWLHHGFIDRNFRVWQNMDSSRVTCVDGTDHVGTRLQLSTGISVNGLRPGVTIGDVINTMGGKLCYKYDY